ncbi:MAG: Stp1/IreP family PP2C-type Ser/Thr phosphatase [Acidobacteriota bacterium]
MAQEPNINILLYAQTDIGMVRHGNEDNFLVVDLSTAETWTADSTHHPPEEGIHSVSQGHYGSLVAVSDGMGGALAGEVASQMAVTAVRDRMLQFQATPSFSQYAFHERLRLAIEQANILINVESQNNVEYTGMGATFTAAGVEGDIAYLAQVGDSRCYLIRQSKIAQVTKDQSLVSQLVEAGHITEEEAEQHTYKNVILQALGAQPRVNVIVDRVRLRRNDVLLLCSDGLSGKVKGPEMLKVLNESSDIKAACDTLIKMANERGGEDNITVLIARFDGEGLQEPLSEDSFKGEFIPRDPTLPDEIDPAQLVSPDEETLRPEVPIVIESDGERIDVVETQEVQATMLNIPAVTPQMVAAHASQMSSVSETAPTPTAPSSSTATTEPLPSTPPSAVSAPVTAPVTTAPITAPVSTNNVPSIETNSSYDEATHSIPEDPPAADLASSSRALWVIITVALVTFATLALMFLAWRLYQSRQSAATTLPSPSVNVSPPVQPVQPPQPTPTIVNEVEASLAKTDSKLKDLVGKAVLLPASNRKQKLDKELNSLQAQLTDLNLHKQETKPEELLNQSEKLFTKLSEIEKEFFSEEPPKPAPKPRRKPPIDAPSSETGETNSNPNQN